MSATTPAPHQTTGAPYQSTAAPYQTTGVPYQPGAAPHQPTPAPHQTTGAPYQSTAAPHQTPGAPYQNTAPLRQAPNALPHLGLKPKSRFAGISESTVDAPGDPHPNGAASSPTPQGHAAGIAPGASHATGHSASIGGALPSRPAGGGPSGGHVGQGGAGVSR